MSLAESGPNRPGRIAVPYGTANRVGWGDYSRPVRDRVQQLGGLVVTIPDSEAWMLALEAGISSRHTVFGGTGGMATTLPELHGDPANAAGSGAFAHGVAYGAFAQPAEAQQPNQLTGGIFHNYVAVPTLPPSLLAPRGHATVPSRSQAPDHGLHGSSKQQQQQQRKKGGAGHGAAGGGGGGSGTRSKLAASQSADVGRVQLEDGGASPFMGRH